jgi:hypothetical protein
MGHHVTPADITSWYELITRGGWGIIAVAIIFGGYRQWWVYGWMFRQVKDDRDLLWNAQERTISVTERALRILDEETRT